MAFIFSVTYLFLLLQGIQISHVQPNVRIDLTSVFIFLFFFIPVEGLCCRPKYWANIIHPFDDQNSLTSKCIENWALFERLTTARDRHYRYPPGSPGVCPTPSPRKPALFCPVQGWVYKHLLAPGLTLEKILVSRGEAQPFGRLLSWAPGQLSMIIVYTATGSTR